MPPPRVSTEVRRAYGAPTIEGMDVQYDDPELRRLLRVLLRRDRGRHEGRAKKLVWASERAVLDFSHDNGLTETRRPNGHARSTLGVVLLKQGGDDGGSDDLIVGWIDTQYAHTRQPKRFGPKRPRSVRKKHPEEEFTPVLQQATVVIGRAHTEERDGDVQVSVFGRGMMWVTPDEVVSTIGDPVKNALGGGGLTDKSFFEAKRELDRVGYALEAIEEAMRDGGLNPELASRMPRRKS
jgi:hypothetical protein